MKIEGEGTFPMTEQEIKTIRHSLEIMGKRSEGLAQMFYSRLFRLDPSLRGMFRTDIDVQAKKLMSVLAVVIGSLERFDTLRPTLRHMGSCHAGYGVRPEHYRTVGQALLETLEEVGGTGFNEAMRIAWRKVLTLVSNEMLEGAVGVAASASGATAPPQAEGCEFPSQLRNHMHRQ
jgi:hemoglobin-like flavoprotein